MFDPERVFEEIKKRFSLPYLTKEEGLVRVFSINTNEASEELYSAILEIIEKELRGLKNGEYQKMEISKGENFDSGIKQTEILKGVCYEIYSFDTLTMCYLRVLWERGIFYKREWISVDADEMKKSPWFSEMEP
jgi:hypothetical protein